MSAIARAGSYAATLDRVYFGGCFLFMSAQTLEASLALFNLKPGASYQDARKVYLELIQRWHPDRFESHPSLQDDAVRITQQLNVAFDTISAHLQATSGHTNYSSASDYSYDTDWSDYYGGGTGETGTAGFRPMPEDAVPFSEFERSRPKQFGIFDAVQCLCSAVFAPIFWLVDLAIFCCFEKHSVLVFAAVIYLSHIYG